MKLIDFILSTRDEADPWNACIQELVLSLPEEDQEKIADWFIVNDEVDVRLSVEFLLNDCKYEENYLLECLIKYRFDVLYYDILCIAPSTLVTSKPDFSKDMYSLYFGRVNTEDNKYFFSKFEWTEDFESFLNKKCFDNFKTFPTLDKDGFCFHINISKILN